MSQTVAVKKYRRRGYGFDEKTRDAIVDRLSKKGLDADMVLEVDTGKGVERIEGRTDQKARNGMSWAAMAAYVFVGKGSPEHCQIVLQLAAHWGLTPHGLQTFADQSLGLDCNGFVGNYLWHARRGKEWTDLGIGDKDLGPDASLKSYVQPSRVVTRWDAINPSETYVMAWVRYDPIKRYHDVSQMPGVRDRRRSSREDKRKTVFQFFKCRVIELYQPKFQHRRTYVIEFKLGSRY
jgi:hypothetical protein